MLMTCSLKRQCFLYLGLTIEDILDKRFISTSSSRRDAFLNCRGRLIQPPEHPRLQHPRCCCLSSRCDSLQSACSRNHGTQNTMARGIFRTPQVTAASARRGCGTRLGVSGVKAGAWRHPGDGMAKLPSGVTNFTASSISGNPRWMAVTHLCSLLSFWNTFSTLGILRSAPTLACREEITRFPGRASY